MNHKTVDEVISDFKGRRLAIVKALTLDVHQFYQRCRSTSDSPTNMCLYGFPDQHWDVKLPPNSDLPHPRLGINVDTHSKNKYDWLSMVAFHSEAWLHAVASYFAAKFEFNNPDRKRLFEIILEFPSINSILIGKTSKRTRKKKRVMITGENLPEDLLILVLARLPVKDLVKYRSVCKKFRALIDDPVFVHSHLDTYKGNCDEGRLLVVEDSCNWRKEQVMVRNSNTFRKVMKLNYPKKEGYSICELGYINGLMLINPDNSNRRSCSVELILWNPSINKSLNVPCSVFPSRERFDFLFWLGYDPSCVEYKVIAIGYHWQNFVGEPPSHEVDPGLIYVYTLSTNSWTTKSCPHPPFRWINCRYKVFENGVFVNGAIHCRNNGPKVQYVSGCEVGNSNLIVFDVCKEVFNYMDYPNDTNLNIQMSENYPITLDGLLGIFSTYQDDSHHVWVMEQYGVASSWTKRYTFNLHLGQPRYLKSNGELLFVRDRKGVRSYDAKKELERQLSKTPFTLHSNYKIYRFVESLVLQQSFK